LRNAAAAKQLELEQLKGERERERGERRGRQQQGCMQPWVEW